MDKVKLKSSWVELFGSNSNQITEPERIERWKEWKQLAIANGDSELVDFWTDSSACENCEHLDTDWCKLQGLPCTVNPILTFKQGMIGMACMGLGKKESDAIQLDLFKK